MAAGRRQRTIRYGLQRLLSRVRTHFCAQLKYKQKCSCNHPFLANSQSSSGGTDGPQLFWCFRQRTKPMLGLHLPVAFSFRTGARRSSRKHSRGAFCMFALGVFAPATGALTPEEKGFFHARLLKQLRRVDNIPFSTPPPIIRCLPETKWCQNDPSADRHKLRPCDQLYRPRCTLQVIPQIPHH